MMSFNEWEAERVGKFTASEVHKLMAKGRNGEYFGQTAKKYIRNKTAELLTCERIQGFSNDAMEWGNAHEEEAATAFENKTGLRFTYHGVAFPKFYDHTDFSGGSPDGVGDDFIIEIKCPYNSGEHLEHLLITNATELKEYAPEYYWQMVMNMLVCGKSHGYFISYDPRYAIESQQLKVLKIEPLECDVDKLKERLAEAEKQLSVTIEAVKDVTELTT